MNQGKQIVQRRKKNRGRRPTRRQIPLPVGVQPSHRCILKYTSHITGATNTGVQFTSTGWYINGPYASNISGADTSQPDMFASLAALYNNYIVERCDIDVWVSNRETFSANVSIGAYPGTKSIGTAAEALDVGESPYGQNYLLSGNAGQNRCRYRKSVPLHSLWNQQYYRGEGGFQGSSTSNPSIHASLYVNAIAATGSTMDNGVAYNVKFNYVILFSGRMGTDQVTLLKFPPVVHVPVRDPRNTTVDEVVSDFNQFDAAAFAAAF